MNPKPALELDLNQYGKGVNAKIEAWISSDDHGYILTLTVGSFCMLLIDNTAYRHPIKFPSQKIVKQTMSELAAMLMSDEMSFNFKIEQVAMIGDRKIDKIWISFNIENRQFLVVNREGSAFKFLFFHKKSDADLVASDIARNLGGDINTGESAEEE